jgi:P4 family phage/plasmid primase-like protien
MQAPAPEEDYRQAACLVRLLDNGRADEYQSWMRVGWCLHNIDHRLARDWEEFSMRSPKYEQGLCETLWEHMVSQRDGLGLGSLHMWAREDSPVDHGRLLRERMGSKVRVAISGTHHDVAVVVAAVFSSQYACCSIRNNQWYEFRAHRWHPCDSGFSLRLQLSTEVVGRFLEEANRCTTESTRAHARSTNNPEVAKLNEMAKKALDVAGKLKTTAFKECVMKELRELLYHPDFESRLDSKPNLIGFENGVYDLNADEFRDGTPDDMLSFCTRNAFVPYRQDAPEVMDIMRFFGQIQPVAAVREYMLRLLGSFLNGSIREEKFHFWTGVGSNGKSLMVDLFERAFGDYCAKLPVSLLTQKRASSNSATSEVARLKGKRFACLQEPGHDEVLNVGLMKELTGGDRIMARALYKEPIEFRPQMKMVMVCNTLPEVPSSDYGTWRRIVRTDFNSKFVEEPNPAAPHEFKVDTSITDRLDEWAPHTMGILIQYHRKYRACGNPIPEEVLAPTKAFRQTNDVIQLFIDERLETGDDRRIEVEALYESWKEFVRSAGFQGGPNVKRHDFVIAIARHVPGVVMLGTCVVKGVGARKEREPSMPGLGAFVRQEEAEE